MSWLPAQRDAALNPLPHTEWCSRGHHCGLGEHRAAPIVLEVPTLGRMVLTRVQGHDGRQHAEITATVALAEAEPYARAQLLALTADLEALLRRATLASERPRKAT
jgi:hypothetical protein